MSALETLTAIAARLLECDPAGLDPDTAPLELGFDSLLAIGLAHEAETALGVVLPVGDILAGRTLRELAESATGGSRAAVTAGERPDRLPLSAAQRRMWVLDQLDPGAYVLVGAIRLPREPDAADLAARLTRVAERHEVLRTVFPSDADGPHQHVLPAGWVEVATLPEGADAVAALTADPFDLARGPLVRAAVVGRDLVLAAHHIVCDGWSLDVVLDELTAEDPAPPPVQYADYSLWHHRVLDSGERERQLAHWRERFAEVPAPLELPVDHARTTADGAGAVHEHVVPAEVRAALAGVAREHGVTTFVVLHAAYATFLSRITGQTDVVVATPVANRPDPALDRLVGFFVNTLALRTDLGDAPTFGVLLRRCRDTLLDAQRNQDLPFDELVDALVPTRAPGAAPLAQTMLTVRRRIDRAGATARELHTGTAKFDLSLDVEDTGVEFALRWEYRTALFDEATIAGFAGWFTVLLQGIADRPGWPVDHLPLLTAAEITARADLGEGLPVTKAPSALSRFARATRRFADRTALRAGADTVTYAELSARVHALADRLVALGAGPEALVGLHAGRGIDTVVGLWAVLHTGAGYLPLDPTHPPRRLEQIVAAADPVVVLAEPDLPELPARTIPLTEKSDVDADVQRTAPLPENLAYVLYTSGSTGVPKGVAVTHANLANLLVAMDELLAGHDQQTWLALTSTAFDISVVELIWTLTTGATVVFPDDSPVTDQLDGITHLQTTPSYATKLLTRDVSALAGLDTLLLGGEAISPALRELLHQLPHTRHINGYGPTEATVYATTAPIDTTAATTPIGLPVPGVTARPLDRALAITPTTGELCLGGAGVARGYLGNPRLTAARFTPDPHGEPGARVYRTGDLAHAEPDGVLHFHGRADQQTKVNGYRVELGDITAALTAHPAVRAAHTALTPGPEITSYLVGDADETDLRAHLRGLLPTWMHPAHLVALPELPLTVNGKLDTARLPLPDRAARVHRAPEGATEQVLASIWAELLGTAEPGRDDDFFASGGQSLLAAQLAARVRAALGRKLSVRAVFEHPTIADLAAHLDTCPRGDTASLPLPRPARLPLSAAQRRIWVQAQLSTKDAYVIAGAVRITGEVDPAELGARLDALVARHEALRTVFPHDADGPHQVVHPAGPVPLPVITAGERRELINRPFDLGTGPLLRAALVPADSGVELLVAVHHIVCDGWSLGVLLAELTGSTAEPLPLQYADYTLAEADHDHAAHLAHWRSRLADLPDALRLPTDHPRPVGSDGRGANHHQVLDADLTERLRAFAAERGATLFMVVAAAYAALLGRLSRSTDVLIGTPVSHRPDPALEPLVGLFLNTVALRLDLSDDPTAAGLVARARDAVLGAHEHQDVPFEHVVRELGAVAEPDVHPVFQTMLSVRPELPGVVTADGVEYRASAVDTGTAKFDLSVEVVGIDGPAPGLRWEYRTELFTPATVAGFAGHLRTLLAAIADAPATPVSALPVLTGVQRAAAVGHRAPAGTTGVLTRWRAALARHGDRTALVQGDRTLTYTELADRAHALAARLRAEGAGPESLVGLHSVRGVDTVVGLWATLLTGAAYLPLDPTHPPARLRRITDDANPVAVLTEPAAGPAPTTGVPVLDLNSDHLADQPAATDPGVDPHPESLAYVLYTSGSTGVPKGVAVTHANLANLLHAMDDLLGTPEPQTWLALTSPAFDISVVELVWTLTTGATVVLPDAGDESAALPGVTHLQTTPSYATRLLTRDTAALSGLTTLMLGGEAISPALRELLHQLPHTRHINGYGPTEATVYATTAPIDTTATTTPIGTAVPGTGAVVLEPSLLPAPDHVIGRLHLSGAGVSRGYLGNPRLTAQRFRPDPYGEPGARVYDTGDLAHRDPGGVLHFHGRADQQTKVNGYRVELGEVTAVLVRHPAVRSAHTTLGPDGDIVSYVVWAGEPAADALAAHLGEQLPAWMRPAHLLPLDELPLTVNGKLDTRRLPAPTTAPAPPTPPRTAAEHLVAALFAELLGVPVDSTADDFFRRGGHSLLATRLAARLGLPLRAVFDHPTVGALAAHLNTTGTAPTPARRPRPDRLPLSPAQRRLWFLEQLAPGAYAVPVSVRISPRIDHARLAAALDGLVARHEALRTTFPHDADGPVQHIAEPAPTPLPVLDAERVAAWRDAPFDLAEGPLVRAAVVEHADSTELLLVLHHSTCDGWSLDLLLDELVATLDGTPPTDEPAQCADHTLWQADLLAGGERDRQLGYWRTRLADPPAALLLPTDRPRPDGPTVHGAQHTHALPTEVATGLRDLAAAHGTTVFAALYAAYTVLLTRLSGQSDVVVGTPVANRTGTELASVVGFLANTLALRTPVEPSTPFAALLDRCHRTLVEAQEHQDLPFEEIVDELRLPRDHTRNPLFQAMLTLRHERGGRTAAGHAITTVGEDTGTAKADLTLAVHQDPAGGLELRWEYPTELFDAATAARFAECFTVLTAAAVSAPETAVDALPLLSPEARDRAIASGTTDATPDAHVLVLDGFAARVAETPDAVALRDDSGALTYGELDRRSRDLAAHLRGLGVGPDTLVGLHAHRGTGLVVGIVAILRAGGAYLPLDPAYPPARVRAIVSDARPPVVLFDAPLPELAGVTAVPLDLPLPTADDPVTVHPGNLAYVIYTSGSTGTPKGVAVTHANLASSTAARSGVYDGPVRGFVLVSSPAFDTSVASIFWSLTAGAELHLPADGAQLDLDHLESLLRKPSASHLVCLPSLWRLLLARFEGDPGALRVVAVAGEPVDPALVDLHHRTCPDVALFNEYGPTENTVWSTAARLSPGTAVSIGAPIPGSGAHVLDARLEPCPDGVVGEVWLTGSGLARGYLRNARLTANRFRPDPHGAPGTRAYRTGDLAHRAADGRLSFRGRVDAQVKIRGYRVEPDEVTATLLRHPAVSAAHTVVRQGPGGPELVAYTVADTTPAELRAHLAGHLPDWLRPAHLVALPALPLTPNGKVDAQALPAPTPESVAGAAPTTPAEERVSEVLRQLLGTGGIGVDHSFFELGAHSLLLVQACELLRPMRADLRVVDLFRYPTVRTLAAYLSGGPQRTDSPAVDPGSGRARLTRRRARAARVPDRTEPMTEPMEAP
ncbi:Siderophore biosynthesis non-ribosomal peptide synthetase module [Actinokineospora spheciospongiae]|uniref:Siderophore biosynthesis non-ribosomal peptide synthetase module n=1 Tax=Actinokineospora spheciospongiae TaxID=909613 RepID=W7JCB5_9PSEU|nr:non-ribosomal peptide synthetase [Actinokineospora spheciospongiae]EWC63674.1 Siderophore biosynthesis non-ribosomal peptide synthetase module [Actinokineospora spheciospongiae]